MYTVLITCVGGEMAPFMIQTLKESKRHEVKIVGVDADHSAIGKNFCDNFVTVPYGDDIGYANSIKEIVNTYSVDLIIPTSDEEAMALSLLKGDFEKQGCVLACIDANILSILIDKAKTYKFLRKFNIHTPKTIIIDQFHELKAAVESMCHDLGECVIKPARARGGRGVYVVSSQYDKIEYFIDKREVHSDLENFFNSLIYKLEDDLPLIVMERLVEPVIDIDLLGWNGKDIRVIPRRRVNSAVPNDGHILIDDNLLVDLGKELIKIFELSWLYDCDVMFDQKGNPCVLELNPRQSGSVAVSLSAGIELLDDVIDLAKGNVDSILEKNVPYNAKIIPFKSLILKKK